MSKLNLALYYKKNRYNPDRIYSRNTRTAQHRQCDVGICCDWVGDAERGTFAWGAE